MRDLWSFAEIAKALGLKEKRQYSICGISIDSRTVAEGELFVALRGENMDGHDYVADAFKKGAKAALVDRILPEYENEKESLILVKDSFEGLKALAKYRRNISKAKFVAITGSVGKTSTKEMFYEVLSKLSGGKAFCSFGNYNNHIGVPLSLARMPSNCEYGIFEIGMNHRGEISPLAKMVRPDVAVITTIAPVHLEFFNSVEEIAIEKSDIFVGLNQNGVAIINRDSEYYPVMNKSARDYGVKNIRTFGSNSSSDFRLDDYKNESHGSKISCNCNGKEFSYDLGISGLHQALNSLAVLAGVDFLDLSISNAAKCFAEINPAKGRGAMSKYKLSGKDVFIIDDSYNASPESMRAAFKVLAEKNSFYKKKILVLGDMFELGEGAALMHKNLAEDIVKNKIDIVFTVGDLMQNLYDALPQNKRGGHYKDKESAAKAILSVLNDNDILLVKGSRGMKMEKVIELLVA